MKNIKKILFMFLLIFVGVLTVSALDTGGDSGGSGDAGDPGTLRPTPIPLWQSIVTDITANIGGANNCKIYTNGENAVDMLDAFIVGNDCVVTGVQKGQRYTFIGRGDSGSVTGASYFGDVVDSTNNMADSNVLLSEIVELVYKNDSKTTQELKKFAMQNSEWKGSSTAYELHAGSSDNALYIYGGYVGQTMAGIKLNYNTSTKKFTYEISSSTANTHEYRLAVLFTTYLVDYIMEASPNYNEASTIINDQEKFNKIKDKFENNYGSVSYSANGSNATIKVDLAAKGDINSQIVNLYNNTGTGDAGTGGSGSGGSGSGSTGSGSGGSAEEEGNPNTGAFVNVFAIVALISVGTVLILGNKRKLFRI